MFFNKYKCCVQNMNGVGENVGIVAVVATLLRLKIKKNIKNTHILHELYTSQENKTIKINSTSLHIFNCQSFLSHNS